MPRRLALLRSIPAYLGALALASIPFLACPGSARAAFHVNEITKIMVGYNGDATIQAVELKMLANGENLVTGAAIKVYDKDAVLVGTLGTFAGSLPAAGALTGRKILCATSGFATAFGITPDLVISSGLAVGVGQVSFETATCLVNAIPYGGVVVYKNGTTAAPPILADGATVLVRVTDDATFPTCPLTEDANAKFRLASGSSGFQITFTNNANDTANVYTTVTGAEDAPPPATAAVRVYPNPIRGSARVEAPAWRPLTVHDVQGRLVRVLTCLGACPAVAGPFRGEWDGTDQDGHPLPPGVYFLRYADTAGPVLKRVVLLR